MLLSCAGCASYETPGGAVHLGDIDRADLAGAAAQQPSPRFPASIAVVRVQASQYRAYAAASYGSGRFSVVTTADLPSEQQFKALSTWPAVALVAPLDPLLLPAKLDSLDELRLAAAKSQADVLLIYTVDTTFQIKGRAYGPQASISLGLVPDSDAHITSTASAIFTDVRTGFSYGSTEATVKLAGLAEAWGSSDAVDKKRVEAEQQAFALLLSQAEKSWTGIEQQYQ